MDKVLCSILALFLVGANCSAQIPVKNKQAVDYVNPLIGTPFAGFSEGLEGGGTMPCMGKQLQTPFIGYKDIVNGSKLVF